MTIWMVSDLHFGHRNIIKPEYDARPFNTVEEMDEAFIDRWNEVMTSPDDLMINLGDFFFQGTRLIDSIYPRLHGECIEVLGNHDYNKQIRMLERYDNFTCTKHLDFTYRDIHVWCAHKPDDPWFDQVDWDNEYNLRIAGHWHSAAPRGLQHDWVGVPWNNLHDHGGAQNTEPVSLPGWSYNVSIDVTGYKPIALDQIIDEMMEAHSG